MRRNIHYLVFWLLYWSVSLYLNFFWLKSYEAELINRDYLLLKAALGTLLYIAPLAGLAYYFVGVGLELLLNPWKSFLVKCAAITFPYLLSIVLVIAIMRLFVFPFIFLFKESPGDVFFDPIRFFSIMIEAAFPAAFLIIYKFIDTRVAMAEREKNLVKERLSTELRFLKSQLNPHFLFNTLNNLYALTRKKNDQAPEVVMKLSELLSFTLYEAGSETIPLHKELKFLEDYVALQKIRYGDNLKISNVASVDDPEQPIVPLLLLPLVENAFKHGAGETHFDSFINISINLKKGRFVFIIENSVEDIFPGTQTEKIGLSSTRRQLELTYGEQEMEIVRSDDTFKATLKINLDSYGNL